LGCWPWQAALEAQNRAGSRAQAGPSRGVRVIVFDTLRLGGWIGAGIIKTSTAWGNANASRGRWGQDWPMTGGWAHYGKVHERCAHRENLPDELEQLRPEPEGSAGSIIRTEEPDARPSCNYINMVWRAAGMAAGFGSRGPGAGLKSKFIIGPPFPRSDQRCSPTLGPARQAALGPIFSPASCLSITSPIPKLVWGDRSKPDVSLKPPRK